MEVIILFVVDRTRMKSEGKKEVASGSVTVESELRRSSRARKEPKNDDYFMGSVHLEDLLGNNYYEDEAYPKRRRKNYRYDDSEDYSEGHKHSKKGKQINTNKVEALLEWRYQLQSLPIQVAYLPEYPHGLPIEQLHKAKITKNLVGENLASLAEDVRAIFINIDWGKKGQTIKDLYHLKIESTKLMSKGLVFVWAAKQHLAELLGIMEKKDFVYVQNFQIINFDIQKAKMYWRGQSRNKPKVEAADEKKQEKTQDEQVNYELLIRSLENVNPCDIIAEQEGQYFNRSKRTLLMFKKNNSLKFQLRHQRTCDVVFDMPTSLGQKCGLELKSYVYNMIETLLPDCLQINQKGKNDFDFKMLELWADKDQYRRGWINLVQE